MVEILQREVSWARVPEIVLQNDPALFRPKSKKMTGNSIITFNVVTSQARENTKCSSDLFFLFFRNQTKKTTRQRRIAVRQYWKKKTSDLKENPRTFFETFKPFLGSKKGVLGTDINLKVDGKIISNKETVAEILAGHFATIASDIGDVNLRNSSENDLNNHPSVLQIQMASSSEPMIELERFWSHLIRGKHQDMTICQPEY